jgi:hypothetical protein
LIQNQALMRNVDSKIHSSGFVCCAFLLSDRSVATFATISELKRPSTPPPGRPLTEMLPTIKARAGGERDRPLQDRSSQDHDARRSRS